MIRTLLASAAIAGFAMLPANAGGLAEPVMEPEIIVEETATGTGGGWVVPLILIALVAAVASSSGGGETTILE